MSGGLVGAEETASAWRLFLQLLPWLATCCYSYSSYSSFLLCFSVMVLTVLHPGLVSFIHRGGAQSGSGIGFVTFFFMGGWGRKEMGWEEDGRVGGRHNEALSSNFVFNYAMVILCPRVILCNDF